MKNRLPTTRLSKRMMKYLLDRYRPEIGCWGDLLEPGVNELPHVGWWTYGTETFLPILDGNERVKYYNPNDHAALAAFVALYRELVPKDLYEDIIKYPVEKILRYYDEKLRYTGKVKTWNHRIILNAISNL